MNIQTEAYQVTYDPNTTIITYSGSFRLHTPEYTQIIDAIKAASTEADSLTLDIRELRFLNSSGINMLYKLVTYARDHKEGQLVIRGSQQIPWQKKTLKNFLKMLPGLDLQSE